MIWLAILADKDAAIETFGKIEYVKKVFRVVFAAVAGIMLAQVKDPRKAKQIVGMIVEPEGEKFELFFLDPFPIIGIEKIIRFYQ